MNPERIIRAGKAFRLIVRGALAFTIMGIMLGTSIMKSGDTAPMYALAYLGIALGIFNFVLLWRAGTDLMLVNEPILTKSELRAHSIELKNKAAERAKSEKLHSQKELDTFDPDEIQTINEIPISRLDEKQGDLKLRCPKCKVSAFVRENNNSYICYNCKSHVKVK